MQSVKALHHHGLHKERAPKDIAHPADDDVARWLDEGGHGPEPERVNLRKQAQARSPIPMLLIGAGACVLLLGALAFTRRAR